MRKFLAVLVVLAIIGAIICGVSGIQIVDYIVQFFKNLSIWIFSWLKDFTDMLGEYFKTKSFSISDFFNTAQ